jgi:hypothetical protein
MDDHVGLWTWPFLVVVVAIIGFVRNRIFNFGARAPAAASALASRMNYSQGLLRSRLTARLPAESSARSFKPPRSV